MKLVDLHCDTISKLTFEKKNENLYDSSNSVDIKKLQRSHSLLQVFAMFVYMDGKCDPLKDCLEMADKFYNELDKYKNYIAVVKSYKDIEKNERQNKISALLSVEEGGVIEGKLYNLRNLYRLGVRLMTLSWNFPNEIGFPNCKQEYMKNGLTDFGKEVVEEMNNIGMVIDVSHLSDGGFYDVARLSKKPFVASHSDARSITNHPRNLTDDMIKILSQKGGATGINFCSDFLGNSEHGTIEEMVQHIKHIKKVGGIDVIAIGTDFDGIEKDPEIKNSGEMDKLYCALKDEGFSDDDVEKIFYRNALRVFKDVLK